jgi:hypothetical protein
MGVVVPLVMTTFDSCHVWFLGWLVYCLLRVCFVTFHVLVFFFSRWSFSLQKSQWLFLLGLSQFAECVTHSLINTCITWMFTCSDYLFKLLLIGDSGVGKSCLLLRFAVSYYLHCTVKFSPAFAVEVVWRVSFKQVNLALLKSVVSLLNMNFQSWFSVWSGSESASHTVFQCRTILTWRATSAQLVLTL